MEDMDWVTQAACRGRPDECVTPIGIHTPINAALEIIILCRTQCPVRTQCRNRNHGGVGMIWDGHAHDSTGNRVRECRTCTLPILPVRSGAPQTHCKRCKSQAELQRLMAGAA